jgi:hypothetical protein
MVYCRIELRVEDIALLPLEDVASPSTWLVVYSVAKVGAYG